ncbi:MAG: protease SohB [Gammaproteobacteria bacterium]
MMEFVSNYSLFLAKAATILIFIWLLLSLMVSLTHKPNEQDQIEIKNLNRKFDNLKLLMQKSMLSKKQAKELLKRNKKQNKKNKNENKRQRVFVLNFVGNIKASAVKHLRKEITALLAVATPEDEVVICLENAGGMVHEHGFASSQLERIKQRNIPLTVAVDKVAASGGYMMACVADRIVAAPFSIIGSIGVIAQLPNFNRLLEKHGIEYEQVKAGDLKRTLTMFGKNTDEDRERFAEQMEETHALFKEFVADNRKQIDIQEIATGEHWLGKRALELKLVDELITSDDYLLRKSESADVYEVKHSAPKSVSEKIMGNTQLAFEKAMTILWERKLFS